MIEKAVVFLLCLLVVYASWVHGGSPHGYQPPILWITLCIWAASLLGLAVRMASRRYESARKALKDTTFLRILKDPLFYPSLLFVALLCLQLFNAGRMQYFDHDAGIWRYTEPFYTSLPSAVTKREAGEMFVWFLPPITVALFIRNLGLSRIRIRQIFTFMVVNAALLGLFGIFQFAAKAPGLYWGKPMSSHFFASFGYQNHAGEFFFLMTCLGLGLLFRHVFLDRNAKYWRLKMVVLSIACITMIASIHMALVAASVSLVWFVIAFSVVYSFSVATRHLSPATRLQILIGMVVFCAFAFFAVTGPARDSVMREMQSLASQAEILKDIDTRFWQVVTAWEIWLDNVWFGVGAWGYRYFSAVYLPPEARFLMAQTGRGNVHNDTMQYLAEFGIVGIATLGSFVGIQLYRILRYPMWRHGMYVLLLLGLGLLYLHSMIDLPFRNPAILISTSFCLAGLGCYAKLSRKGEQAGK